MRKAWLMALVLLGVLRTADAANWPLEVFERMDDKRIVVFLTEEDIDSSPAWEPAEGSPPLTLAAVIQVLDTWIQASIDRAGLKIHEIKLKAIPHHELDHHWYYLVQLTKRIDAKTEREYAAILMDGKLVPAIREPASVK